MKKRKHVQRKSKWIGKVRPQDTWHEEDDELRAYFAFIQKLHPGSSLDNDLAELEELGFISLRTKASGKREYRLNRPNLQAALDKIPPEEKHHGLDLPIYEDTAIICDYDNAMTTLLSVIIKQTDELRETNIVPWIIKTHERLILETFGTNTSLADTLSKLEAKTFIEITENGPAQEEAR